VLGQRLQRPSQVVDLEFRRTASALHHAAKDLTATIQPLYRAQGGRQTMLQRERIHGVAQHGRPFTPGSETPVPQIGPTAIAEASILTG
jgi:hypothetical protein